MRLRILMMTVALASFLSGDVLKAQTPSQSQIDDARKKGVEFLKSKQLDDGYWEMTGHDVGLTALCALALLENGVNYSDPIIEKAHRYIKKNTRERGETYDIALAIVLLSRLDEHGNKSIIRDLAARLIAGQNTGGGWSYTCPAKLTSLALTNPDSRPKPPEGPGDNSCTQFAVLGLWTASRIGLDIDQPMAAVAHRFKSTQNSDGGWPYTTAVAKQGETAANPSGTAMTFAGLFGLTVAKANKLRKHQDEREIGGDDKSKSGSSSGSKKSTTGTSTKKTAPKKEDSKKAEDEKKDSSDEPSKIDDGNVLAKDAAFSKGLTKAAEIVAGGDRSNYYLWSVERMGVILGLEKFGTVDWFTMGATSLLASQKSDGSWPEAHNDKGQSQTAFALLFLRKANLGSDITRLLEGDPEKGFVIANREEKPRFQTLDEAVKAAQPGDTIRVEADGPFKLPHVEVNKNLTIEAGFGFFPTFQYDTGFDSRGVRSRPDKDPEARYMLKAAGATLTLEGLKFEFDAPELGTPVPWSAIRASGGSIRMLNCTVTEEGRKGVAMIELTDSASATIRNSLLAGGRAAIEIAASGNQTIEADNCLLFSDNCISVVKHPSVKEADTKLTIRGCTIQGTNAIHSNVTTPISANTESCLFKTDWLGATWLTADNSKQARSWTGADNVYGNSKWIGTNGRSATGINDPKSLGKFWGEEENGSIAKPIVFEGKRPNKSSSHRMRATEFALGAQSELTLTGNRAGMQFLIVGSGRAFSRFRESSLYRDWKQSLLAAADTK